MKENRMTHLIEKKLLGYLKLYREFPFRLKSIDLLGYEENKSMIISIELKVKNWKNAIRQAMLNQTFSNQSYIGVWHKDLTEKCIKMCEKEGIGVIKINNNGIKIISLSENSKFLIPSYKDEIIKTLSRS